MSETDRIFFKDNPFPLGHKIKEFVWSGRLDSEKGLLFDFHLQTVDYNAEDKSDDVEPPESDWKAKIAWNNFHRCTLSSTEWHFGGIVVGTPDAPFSFAALTQRVLVADMLPLEEDFDRDEAAFHIYLLGHDSCANHQLTFTEGQVAGTFDIHWTGRTAMDADDLDDEEFGHDFEAHLTNVPFSGFDLDTGLDTAENQELFAACVLDPASFRLAEGKFSLGRDS